MVAVLEERGIDIENIVSTVEESAHRLTELGKSLGEAKTEYESVKGELDKLEAAQTDLEDKLSGIVERIAKIQAETGEILHLGNGHEKGRGRQGRKEEEEQHEERRRGPRPGGRDLLSMVKKVLEENKNGLTRDDIVNEVLEAGYETHSHNLSQAVSNVLSKLRRDKTVEKDEDRKFHLV